MKTILLLIVSTGFTLVGSYAQNKDCCCKHKTVYNKTVHKTHAIIPRVPAKEQDPTCFLLKKENLGIPGCVDVIYNGNDSYLGYYPKKTRVTPKIPYANTTTATKAVSQKPIFEKVVTDEPIRPCYTYRQHNILVKECLGAFYDNEQWPITTAGMLEYNTENTYMGNYPPDKETQEIKDPEKMENRSIEGKRFPDDDLCLWDCPKK